MVANEISRAVVTVGPDPKARGGIAQVLDTYYNKVFDRPQYIVEAHPGGKVGKLLQFGRSLRELRGYLKRPEVRIVHIHTASGISFRRSAFYVRMAHKAGRRVVLHMHSGKFPAWYDAHRQEADKVLALVDKVVALSPVWEEYYRGIGVADVAIVPNIIDEPRCVPVEPDGKVHALFLGLFVDAKGVFDLLEAVGRRRRELLGRLVLHLGGYGEDGRVAESIARLDIGDIVKVEGWVGGEAKDRLLSEAEVFVLPSHFEGVPISILEAMSHGAAIVASRVGGIPQIVSAENGLLCEAGDVDALGENLVKVVTDSELRRSMGRASQQSVAPYMPDAVSAVLEDLYRSLL